jgi:hypothetical protein
VGGLMTPVNRAVFLRGPGFVRARAAASIDGWIAVDLLEEWISAIRYPAFHNP